MVIKYLNKVVLAIAIVVLFVPTIIAFIYLNSISETPDIPENATVTVAISTGDTIENISDEALIKLIGDDINSAVAFNDPSQLPIYESEAYTMTVKMTYSPTRVTEKTYTCYFNSDSSLCFFKNSDGKVFPFSKDTAAEILKLSVCQTVLSYSSPPAAFFEPEQGAKTLLEPVKTEWSYLNRRGEKIVANSENSAAGKISVIYKKNTDFAAMLSFDTVEGKDGMKCSPSEIYVTAATEKESLETVPLDGLADLLALKNYMDDTKLTFTVEAVWGNEAMSDGFAGTLTYVIDVLYDVPATFILSDSSLTVGNLPLIKAANLNDGEIPKISITNTTTGDVMDYSPYFVEHNGMSLAFVPFDCTRSAGAYSIKITTNDGETELKINIKAKAYTNKALTVSPGIISSSYSDSTVLSFNTTMEDTFAYRENEKLWEGKFSAPISSASKPSKLVEYGQNVTINDAAPVKAMCNVYTASKGTAVFAANAGKIVYAGELALTGKLVVIEHGFGYKTWYWNMGSINVNVGDTVTKGAKIGTVGDTGLIAGSAHQLSYATSIGDVFFNPDLYLKYTMDYFDAQ